MLKCIFSPVDTCDAMNFSTLGAAKKKKKISLPQLHPPVVLLSEGEPERKKGSAMQERMSGEGEEENGGRRKGMIEQEQREGEERLWDDAIMRRINSKTGGWEAEISPLAERYSPQIFCSEWLSMRWGGLKGLGQAAQLRVEEWQF